jgi:hypothetical protein
MPIGPVRIVFGTFELLEAVLINLDTRTLLTSQRVDQRWHQTIKNSSPLQRKLFLLAEPVGDATKSEDITENPFIVGLFRCLSLWRNGDAMTLVPSRAGRRDEVSVKMLEAPNLPLHFRSEEASWRRMFLTNPPMTHVHIDAGYFCNIESPGMYFNWHPRFRVESGITIGMVVGEMLKIQTYCGLGKSKP